MKQLDVDVVGVKLEVERVLAEENTSANVCHTLVGLRYVGIDDDSFVFVVPRALDVGLAEQRVVVCKVFDV